MARLALTALLVKDYDEAITFFAGKLGFAVTEDTRLSTDKRWVVVTPNGGGASLLLARATDERQRAAKGAEAAPSIREAKRNGRRAEWPAVAVEARHGHSPMLRADPGGAIIMLGV